MRQAISDFMRQYIVLIAIPVAAIIVPTLLTWARDLDATARRVRQLDEQNKIVSFWDNWMKTVSIVVPQEGDSNARTERLIRSLTSSARHLLADAGRDVVSIYRDAEYREFLKFRLRFEQFRAFRAGLSWYRRAFLLYKAPNPRAEVYEFLFHFYLVSASVVVPVSLIEIFKMHGVVGWLPPPRVVIGALLANSTILLLVIHLSFLGVTVFLRQRSRRFENDQTYYVRDRIKRRYFRYDETEPGE